MELSSSDKERIQHQYDALAKKTLVGEAKSHRRTPHSVSSPCPGKSPLPASCPAARPPSGTTCSRRRTKSSADRRRCRHRPAQGSFRPRSCSTPGVSGRWLVSSGAGLCGRGSRPACVPPAAGVDRVFCSCVPPFSLACSVSKVLVHR